MPDRHAIYAHLSTDVRVRVSPFMSYDSAIRVFYGCALAAGQVPQTGALRHVVGEYAGTVKHYAVRSADDPNWPREQPSHDVSTADKRDSQTVVAFLCGDSNSLSFTVPS